MYPRIQTRSKKRQVTNVGNPRWCQREGIISLSPTMNKVAMGTIAT